MKYLTILAVVLITSGCTTYSITNKDLLLQPVHKLNPSQEPLKVFPVNVEATMSCYDSRIGNAIKTSCSNARRIKEVTKQFNERGLQPVKPLNESSPTLIVNKDSLNGFLEGVTGFFNIISFGFIPLHHYDDYTVTYTDEANGIDITKTARISSSTSWFSLIYSDLENSDGNWQLRAENNLIRSVLNEVDLNRINNADASTR